jgi:hypothetical protein
MDVCAVFRVVLSRKKKGEERVGVGGRGKYPRVPPHIKGKKKRGKNKPTARYLIDQYGERGKAIKKKASVKICRFWNLTQILSLKSINSKFIAQEVI